MKIGSVVIFTDGAVTVRCRNYTLHSAYPEFYPPAKTIGTVVKIDESGYTRAGGDMVRVQWPSDTTSGNDSWWCYSSFLLEL